MAERTVNDLNDPERRKVLLHASYQAEQMLDLMLRSSCEGGDTESIPYLLRGMLPRLLELNSIVMSAVGDDLESVVSLKNRLSGGWLTVQQATA